MLDRCQAHAQYDIVLVAARVQVSHSVAVQGVGHADHVSRHAGVVGVGLVVGVLLVGECAQPGTVKGAQLVPIRVPLLPQPGQQRSQRRHWHYGTGRC